MTRNQRPSNWPQERSERIAEQRQRLLDRQAEKGVRPTPPKWAAKVVGVSFTPNYPDNLHALREASDEANELGEALRAILVRNPDNEHDGNAVEVHVPGLGSMAMIGHLPRPLAARLAPEMDAGTEWSGIVLDVLIHPDHPDRPGISIEVHREGAVCRCSADEQEAGHRFDCPEIEDATP